MGADPLVSMYLPNPDLQPTGWEPAEFIAAELIEDHRSAPPGDRSDPADLPDDPDDPEQTGVSDANGEATR